MSSISPTFQLHGKNISSRRPLSGGGAINAQLQNSPGGIAGNSSRNSSSSTTGVSGTGDVSNTNGNTNGNGGGTVVTNGANSSIATAASMMTGSVIITAENDGHRSIPGPMGTPKHTRNSERANSLGTTPTTSQMPSCSGPNSATKLSTPPKSATKNTTRNSAPVITNLVSQKDKDLLNQLSSGGGGNKNHNNANLHPTPSSRSIVYGSLYGTGHSMSNAIVGNPGSSGGPGVPRTPGAAGDRSVHPVSGAGGGDAIDMRPANRLIEMRPTDNHTNHNTNKTSTSPSRYSPNRYSSGLYINNPTGGSSQQVGSSSTTPSDAANNHGALGQRQIQLNRAVVGDPDALPGDGFNNSPIMSLPGDTTAIGTPSHMVHVNNTMAASASNVGPPMVVNSHPGQGGHNQLGGGGNTTHHGGQAGNSTHVGWFGPQSVNNMQGGGAVNNPGMAVSFNSTNAHIQRLQQKAAEQQASSNLVTNPAQKGGLEDERFLFLLNHGDVHSIEGKDRAIFAELKHLPETLIYYRAPKEREGCPERLNLDRRKLKNVPLMEGEERLQLLNLQKNQITRIDNLVSLPNLIFLDLYSNKIKKIENLESVATTLRVLMLGKNAIVSGTNKLACVQKLDVLDLHGNELSSLDIKSNAQPVSLRVLNLASNRLGSSTFGGIFEFYDQTNTGRPGNNPSSVPSSSLTTGTGNDGNDGTGNGGCGDSPRVMTSSQDEKITTRSHSSEESNSIATSIATITNPTTAPLFLQLSELNLRRNKISGFSRNFAHQCPNVQRLFVSHNNVKSFSMLSSVLQLRKLQELSLDHNPIAQYEFYKEFLINSDSEGRNTLKILDDKKVTDEERARCREFKNEMRAPVKDDIIVGFGETGNTGNSNSDSTWDDSNSIPVGSILGKYTNDGTIKGIDTVNVIKTEITLTGKDAETTTQNIVSNLLNMGGTSSQPIRAKKDPQGGKSGVQDSILNEINDILENGGKSKLTLNMYQNEDEKYGEHKGPNGEQAGEQTGKDESMSPDSRSFEARGKDGTKQSRTSPSGKCPHGKLFDGKLSDNAAVLEMTAPEDLNATGGLTVNSLKNQPGTALAIPSLIAAAKDPTSTGMDNTKKASSKSPISKTKSKDGKDKDGKDASTKEGGPKGTKSAPSRVDVLRDIREQWLDPAREGKPTRYGYVKREEAFELFIYGRGLDAIAKPEYQSVVSSIHFLFIQVSSVFKYLEKLKLKFVNLQSLSFCRNDIQDIRNLKQLEIIPNLSELRIFQNPVNYKFSDAVLRLQVIKILPKLKIFNLVPISTVEKKEVKRIFDQSGITSSTNPNSNPRLNPLHNLNNYSEHSLRGVTYIGSHYRSGPIFYSPEGIPLVKVEPGGGTSLINYDGSGVPASGSHTVGNAHGSHGTSGNSTSNSAIQKQAHGNSSHIGNNSTSHNGNNSTSLMKNIDGNCDPSMLMLMPTMPTNGWSTTGTKDGTSRDKEPGSSSPKRNKKKEDTEGTLLIGRMRYREDPAYKDCGGLNSLTALALQFQSDYKLDLSYLALHPSIHTNIPNYIHSSSFGHTMNELRSLSFPPGILYAGTHGIISSKLDNGSFNMGSLNAGTLSAARMASETENAVGDGDHSGNEKSGSGCGINHGTNTTHNDIARRAVSKNFLEKRTAHFNHTRPRIRRQITSVLRDVCTIDAKLRGLDREFDTNLVDIVRQAWEDACDHLN